MDHISPASFTGGVLCAERIIIVFPGHMLCCIPSHLLESTYIMVPGSQDSEYNSGIGMQMGECGDKPGP